MIFVTRFQRDRRAARLKRAIELVKNRPVVHHTVDSLWSPDAKWDAVKLLEAARRAVQFDADPITADEFNEFICSRRVNRKES